MVVDGVTLLMERIKNRATTALHPSPEQLLVRPSTPAHRDLTQSSGLHPYRSGANQIMETQSGAKPTDGPLVRADFTVFHRVGTRWADNDMYGHLNNAVYYQLFDTAINAWVTRRVGVAPVDATYIAVTAENGCQFHHELFFPQELAVGLRVTRIGRSSVTYRLGLFVADGESPAAATGHWVHVYVDREKRSVIPVPQSVRDALAGLAI